MITKDVSHIFRSYDIRGIYGKDIDEDMMCRIGGAFAACVPGERVVVARDARVSSPLLQRAFMKGLAGKTAVDAGTVPLGAGMFHAWENKMPFAYVTASHLPREWNGVKFFHETGAGFSQAENERIRDTFLETPPAAHAAVARALHTGVLSAYAEFLLGKLHARRTLSVALDPGNGCAGLIVGDMFRSAGFGTVVVNERVDGGFPGRTPEPNKDPLVALKEAVKDAGAALGIAYDGDGDRMVLVDDRLRILAPERTAYFILTGLLEREQGPLIANVECTRTIDDIGKKFGRQVIRVPVGHTFLVEAAQANSAAFGVETSGHYVIPSLVPFDDALAVSLYAACMLSARDEQLSAIVDAIPDIPFKRLEVPCKDDAEKFGIVGKLRQQLARQYKSVNTMDGVRVDFPDGWVLIRASNTSPVIRLSIEGRTPGIIRRLESQFKEQIHAMLG
ncbi:MAG: hypothetical protein HYY37_01925 [Candidatus Aenigmarchaeota archaeon]|nr:hypothetical protein [Candidatus Aenigmarchaeota archaeon]